MERSEPSTLLEACDRAGGQNQFRERQGSALRSCGICRGNNRYRPFWPAAGQAYSNGCAVSLYGRFFGGGAIHPSAQLAGSGVTVSGGAEKFPVAVNRIIAPFPRPLMVIDCRRGLL